MFPDSPRSSSRGATRNEIVEVSAALLADGVDISLRGIASRMGLTAPALYRYVRTRDELLEMVVFELDRQPTAEFRAAAGRYAEDDPAARIAAAAVALRGWAITRPHEFRLAFQHLRSPTGPSAHKLFPTATSAAFFGDLLRNSCRQNRAAGDEEISLAQVKAWSSLYGLVVIENAGHCDHRVVESGALFVATVVDLLRMLGLADAPERVRTIVYAELGRSRREI